ncbi:hypothetical protein [Taibaiella koreensis]|uniref:hypothetical protein n=1 Tax=Taibaiella koreensis TaxID=1268548 RepID=UPI0013C3519D|nr:hypothetical protein [Taibaiella koreensis]
MKLMSSCLVLIPICGCVYDPPVGFITINNNSNSVVYTRYSDTDYMRPEYAMKAFTINTHMFDERGKRKDSIVFPEYRALPHGKAYLHGFGTLEKRQIPGSKEAVYLFFISEEALKTKSWTEICESNLYLKKMRFSKHVLDSLDWKVTYE